MHFFTTRWEFQLKRRGRKMLTNKEMRFDSQVDVIITIISFSKTKYVEISSLIEKKISNIMYDNQQMLKL